MTALRHPLHRLLRTRYSPLAFAATPVTDDMIHSLLEAARWAPSCYNAQPWHFIVGSENVLETREKILSCLVPANQKWAATAPVLMLTVARLAFTHNGESNQYATHDVGLAVAHLTLQASEMGLGVHQMAGFDPDMAREVFAVPDGYSPLTAIAVGFPGDPNQLPAPLRERALSERTRNPINSFVFKDSWGVPFT